MKDKCCFCHKERDGKWALLFSPPAIEDLVRKHHVCPECYDKLFENKRRNKIMKIIFNGKEKELTEGTVNYDQVRNWNNSTSPTVTVRYPVKSVEKDRILTVGESAPIVEGMVINAATT